MHRNSLHFFYTNNERLAREVKETIIFTIIPRRIKYIGINLLKEARDLYFENCRMLMKEIKYNTDRKIEDLLEKEMATHSSILSWRIPG